MAETRLQDIIVPEVFLPYVKQETMQNSALFTSGLVAEDNRIAVGTRAGGETVHMPFWNDLEGDAEEISDKKDLTVGGITTGQDIAVAQYLGKAFSHNDLVGLLAGDDPAGARADRLSRSDRGKGQGRRLPDQGRPLPLHRQRQGDRDGRARGPGEDRVRRQDGRTPRRPHGRPGSDGDDPGLRHRPHARIDGSRADAHGLPAPDRVGDDA